MPFAPKLAATALAAATVATLSVVLAAPVYADPVPAPIPPIDGGGTLGWTWTVADRVSGLVFRCHTIEFEDVGTRQCVEDPFPS